MHELSIAMSLVELACDHAGSLAMDERITHVHVRLGRWCGVSLAALRFSFDLATEGSPVAGAALAIEEVPIEIACGSCSSVATLEPGQPLGCPHCGHPGPRVTRGRELELVALEVGHAPANR